MRRAVSTLLSVLALSAVSALAAPSEARAPQGVVVEELQPDGALAKAGLEIGDRILGWERADGGEARQGFLGSPFDWWWLRTEIIPLGPLDLLGERQSLPQRWRVEPGLLASAVRPVLDGDLLAAYRQGQDLLAGGEAGAAAAIWQRAARTAEDAQQRSWLWLRTARAWSKAGEWQSAEAAFGEASGPESGPRIAYRVHLVRGAAYLGQGDARRAEEAFLAARQVAAEAWGQAFGVARVEMLLGDLDDDGGDLEAAEAHLGRALAIADRLAPDGLPTAQAASKLGSVTGARGALDDSQRHQERALAIFDRLAPGTLEVATSLGHLGIVAWSRGDLRLAEDYYRRALAIEERLDPDGISITGTLNNLGIIASDRGDLELAEGYYRRALAGVAKVDPGSRRQAIMELNLGTVAWQRRDPATAESFFRRSLEYFSQHAPQGVEMAAVLDNLGLTAKARQEIGAAEEHHQRALEIRRRLAPGSLQIATSLQNLGTLAREQGDLDRAVGYLQKALEIKEELAPGSLELAGALHGLGEIALLRGDLGLAEERLHRALALHRRVDSKSQEEAILLHTLGRFSRRAGRREEAAAFLDAACSVLEAQVDRLGGSYDAGTSFRARYRHLYRDAIEVALELGRPAAAFHLLERSRARGLLAMLAERELLFGELPAELARRRRDLAREHDRHLRRLAELDSVAEVERLREIAGQLQQVRREQAALIAELRSASPRLAALHYPVPLDLPRARTALDPGTVMLSYSVGEAATDLFVLPAGRRLSVHRLEIGEAELRKEVGKLSQWIRRSAWPRHLEGFRAVSRRLYDLLIAPATAGIEGAERLLLVPDGPLHALPFAALLGSSSAGEHYLVEWKPLHTAQSATLFAELEGMRGRDRGEPGIDIAAFGDPRYPPSAAPEERGDLRLRSASRRGLFDWRPLPHSRREVEAISALFEAGAARVYLGQEATEERAKELDRGVRIVHFATHAHVDDLEPLSSALALTIPEDPGEDRENGLLQAWEIFESLRLDADLVVLSACRSGAGPELAGEGLLGLTRAFQYAGARSVVASLWRVDDLAASELMVRFHRHLRQGLSKDVALRAAQLELLRPPSQRPSGKDLSAPFYWAAFQTIGDWK